MPLPLPRYRIYTRLATYLQLLREIFFSAPRSGNATRVFEDRVKRQVGAPHAVAMPKARVGIYLTVRALVPPGKKVLLSPLTISDVVNMVICAGAIPEFVDVERPTTNADPAEIERKIDADTGAVLVTHLHGCACDMDRIVESCRRRNVLVIEDAAQAYGAVWRGQPVGTFGDAGIYSFGMYKNVNTFFGGMVVTRRDDLARRLREEVESFPFQEKDYYLTKVSSAIATDLATWPPLFRAFTFWVFRFGYLHGIDALNSRVRVDIDPTMKRVLPESYLRRMMPAQAKLALPQLDHVDRDTDRRIALARVYHDGLHDLAGIVLPPLRLDRSHIYTYFPVQVPDRRALVRDLLTAGCDVAESHLRNCASLPCFTEFAGDCPRAEATAGGLVLLPTYPRYSEANVRANVRAVRKSLGRS